MKQEGTKRKTVWLSIWVRRQEASKACEMIYAAHAAI